MAQPIVAPPVNPEQEPQQAAPVAPQRPGQAPVVVMPQQQEKHTILPELPNARFHMSGSIAKEARGGWKRISMNTVQSDDNRFTITQIDPTRRSKWFLLKDMETGESYEEETMTSAKKKAKQIAGIEQDVEEDEGLDEDFGFYEPPSAASSEDILNTETTYRTAHFAVEDTMAKPIKTAATSDDQKWARLRQVAAEEPKEADSAIAEVADALGTMADALSNLREHLDLIQAPKSASIKVRIAAARKYASAFRRLAEETPEVVAGAIGEVYTSLDDVAGALENLAENLGIDLNLCPVEEAFAEEGKAEIEGTIPESHDTDPEVVDEDKFDEAEEEIESESEEQEEEEPEVKEAAATEWTTDRDEEGEPKSPVTAAKKKKKELPDFLKSKDDKKDKKKEKKADGSAPFVSDRDENAKPETPTKLDIPEAQGESEVNKAAALRASLREKIAKRWGVEV